MIEIRPPETPRIEKSLSVRENSARLPDLARHEIVQARVITTSTNRGTVLALKERTVIARSHVPLEKGQLLLLKVEQTSPAPLLRLLGVLSFSAGPPALLQAAKENPWRTLFETPARAGAAAVAQKAVKGLIKDLSLKFAENPDRRSLKNWIERSGLAWESKLRGLALQNRLESEDLRRAAAGDLKGALAGMLKKEDTASPAAERLLKVIETLQWVNWGSLTQTGKLLLLIPCQFSDGSWTVAELLIQKEPRDSCRDSEEGKPCRIVLTAQLETLGWVRAEATIEDKEVGILFLAESAESLRRIEDRLEALLESLRERGFRVGRARCEILAEERLSRSLVHELNAVGPQGFSAFA